jgi:shikimate kinase
MLKYNINFKKWFENEVLAHIAGASGSGKTTLGNEISDFDSSIIVKDLDEFDDESESILGYSNIMKKDYTDEMLFNLSKTKQQLMDDFIEKSTKPIIFIGHHTEGDHILHIPTKNKFLLNIDAKTSALRNYQRSQKQDPKYRKSIEEIPQDEKEANEIINWLLKNGYKPLSREQILQWIKKI